VARAAGLPAEIQHTPRGYRGQVSGRVRAPGVRPGHRLGCALVLSVVPSPVLVRAPSKVNLHLGVGALRPDGYHASTTVFQALSLGDDLRISPAAALTVRVSGEGAAEVPTDRANLVWKAAVRLAHMVGRAPLVEIVIDKGIPVAGGMAGGSADAAATLV